MDKLLGKTRFLCGEEITEADVIEFVALFRYDPLLSWVLTQKGERILLRTHCTHLVSLSSHPQKTHTRTHRHIPFLYEVPTHIYRILNISYKIHINIYFMPCLSVWFCTLFFFPDPNIWGWLRDVFQLPDVAETCDLREIYLSTG